MLATSLGVKCNIQRNEGGLSLYKVYLTYDVAKSINNNKKALIKKSVNKKKR